MNTRKYPRTLSEAFGPYTSRDFVEPMHKSDRVVTAASIAAGLVLLALFSLGVV